MPGVSTTSTATAAARGAAAAASPARNDGALPAAHPGPPPRSARPAPPRAREQRPDPAVCLAGPGRGSGRHGRPHRVPYPVGRRRGQSHARLPLVPLGAEVADLLAPVPGQVEVAGPGDGLVEHLEVEDLV